MWKSQIWCILLSCLIISCNCLLTEIGNLYIPQTDIGGVESIAIDTINQQIFSANSADGTIDIIQYDIEATTNNNVQLQLNDLYKTSKSIDIRLESINYLNSDLLSISSIMYSSRKKYIISTIIPHNYAIEYGYVVFINLINNEILFLELINCYSPNYIISTYDDNRIIISCEGIKDNNNNNPEGSISVIDIYSDNQNEWSVSNVNFQEYNNNGNRKLHQQIYNPSRSQKFSIYVEPQRITVDGNAHYAYITLQENNGIAVLDVYKLEIIDIYSMGYHNYEYSGLHSSDINNYISIQSMPFSILYGLRQSNGIEYLYYNNKQYLLTANQGNSKNYDTIRINEIILNNYNFEFITNDKYFGRLQISKYLGKNEDDQDGNTYNNLYTFGSRDFTIWEIETNKDPNCLCSYPNGIKLKYSSLDEFEHITYNKLGTNGFNSDYYNPSFNTRSDDNGPAPKSIIVGKCNNGNVYAFIGLERVGGIMVYDITNIDDNSNVYFVEYINTRNFDVYYNENERSPQDAGDVDPNQLKFIPQDVYGNALLIVGYRYSASIGIYQFDCNNNNNNNNDDYNDMPMEEGEPRPGSGGAAVNVDQQDIYPLATCQEQERCLNVDVITYEINPDTHFEYKICIHWDKSNVYCSKNDDYIDHGFSLNNNNLPWYNGVDNEMCVTVLCDEYGIFNIKDGNGCGESNEYMTSIDGIDYIECNGNQATDKEPCVWYIPSPECEKHQINYNTTAVVDTNNNDESNDDEEELGDYDWPSFDEKYNQEDSTNNQEDNDDEEEDEDTKPIEDKQYNGRYDAFFIPECEDQEECLNVDVTHYIRDQYEICIYWDSTKTNCNKRDDSYISYGCDGERIKDVKYEWHEGSLHQLCQVVSCDGYAIFGIGDDDDGDGDGDGCKYSNNIMTTINDIQNIECSNTGYCDKEGSCKWTIPAPICTQIEDDGDTPADQYELVTTSKPKTELKTTHIYERATFYGILFGAIATIGSLVYCSVRYAIRRKRRLFLEEFNDD